MIDNPRDGYRVPDIVLERYRLRELPAEEIARVERLLDGAPEFRRRLEALDESDAEVRGRYPAEWLAQRIQARIAERGSGFAELRPSRARWVVPAALATATAMLILAIPPAVKELQLSYSGGVSEERIKAKGPALAVYRRTAEGKSETLADGAVARTGDLIRLGYRAAGRAYGVIVSIDGRGGVTLHLPPTAGRSAALDRNGIVLLDRAYELDDAPGWERFYLVTSESPFDADGVVESARRAASSNRSSPPATLAVPRGFEQAAFTLQKDRQP